MAIISNIFTLFINSGNQLLEFDADNFACATKPELNNDLALGLLYESFFNFKDFLSKGNEILKVAKFHYFNFHPFYSYPSLTFTDIIVPINEFILY